MAVGSPTSAPPAQAPAAVSPPDAAPLESKPTLPAPLGRPAPVPFAANNFAVSLPAPTAKANAGVATQPSGWQMCTNDKSCPVPQVDPATKQRFDDLDQLLSDSESRRAQLTATLAKTPNPVGKAAIQSEIDKLSALEEPLGKWMANPTPDSEGLNAAYNRLADALSTAVKI